MTKNNGFMGNWETQALLYGLCTLFSTFYAVDAVRELLSPERSAQLIEALGTPAFYAITVARFLVCVWVAVAFARMAWKAFKERDDQ